MMGVYTEPGCLLYVSRGNRTIISGNSASAGGFIIRLTDFAYRGTEEDTVKRS